MEIASHTSYRIGGPVDVFVEVQKVEDLYVISEYLNTHFGVQYQILGGGTNVLYPEHFTGVVIHPGDGFQYVNHIEDCIEVGAGTEWMNAIKKAAGWGFEGMAFGAGIPGSIGGAVKGNAGAFGQCISDNLKSVKGIDFMTREAKVFSKEDIQWSYRSSSIPSSFFITEVQICMDRGSISSAMQEIARILALRKSKHPSEPSAGSVFINPRPPDVIAGRMIEELGFKGHRVGDAMCSPKHANFIVNVGNATQSDVLALIGEIKQAVKKKYGYDLREEIKVIKSREEINKMEDNNG
jgi:UDP-N-acetylmuramate dehydrogenase